MNKVVQPCTFGGTITIPASKSDGQRALLCAALAQGTSILTNVGNSNDEKAMLQNIVELGAKVELKNDGTYAITGAQELPTNLTLNCHESGLGVRLLTSVAATLDGHKTIEGSGSILQRTHAFFSETLPAMGVKFNADNTKLPFTMSGKMKGGNYTVDGSQSSQFISGLLMAMPLLQDDSSLTVDGLVSKSYVRLTLNTLTAFGIEIEEEELRLFKIRGNQRYISTSYQVEGDWSSASYWLVATALGNDLVVNGLTMESDQPDSQLLTALENANCRIQINLVDRSITVDGTQRKPFAFDATDCPDLFPALVCLAAYCKGTSVIKGVHRLVNKESNRAVTLMEEFGKLGVAIDLIDDAMHIKGTGEINAGNTIVDAHNDHRIAMCLAIAGAKSHNGLTIQGAECVAKSYPEFWEYFIAISSDR